MLELDQGDDIFTKSPSLFVCNGQCRLDIAINLFRCGAGWQKICQCHQLMMQVELGADWVIQVGDQQNETQKEM